MVISEETQQLIIQKFTQDHHVCLMKTAHFYNVSLLIYVDGTQVVVEYYGSDERLAMRSSNLGRSYHIFNKATAHYVCNILEDVHGKEWPHFLV